MPHIDVAIICLYFVFVTVVGIYISRRMASHSAEDYFLGGRSLPWYLLAISGVAAYVDISGTMLQSSFFYMIGVKGYWVAYRGAVALSLAFLMIFMAKWMRRSEVMTIAEWMQFRFGRGRQGEMARLLCAVSTLVMAIVFVGYFFIGTGKFLSLYLPMSPTMCALLFFTVVTIYTSLGGFNSVVYLDLIQSGFVLTAMGYVGYKAMTIATPVYYSAVNAPSDWLTLFPTTWAVHMPAGYENMQFLGVLVIFWMISMVLQGFAQPYDAWTSQRYFASKDQREGAMVAATWIFLLSFRFILMMGLGILALGIADKIEDPEMALPAVIEYYMPIGIRGLFVSALLAAGMGVLSAILNSTAAYFVKDIYQQYIKPSASPNHLVKVGYVTTVAIMAAGAFIGSIAPNINSIWAWICMGLVTGMLPPNIIKWFWWRFNGMGYVFGMIFGILGAVIHQIAVKDPSEYTTFTVVIIVSTIGTILGTFAGKPVDRDILINFYRKTKPFGFWKPMRSLFNGKDLAVVDAQNRRDLWLLIPACLWQLLLFWLMTAFVAKLWQSFFISVVVTIVLSCVLYKYWYKNLSAEDYKITPLGPGRTAQDEERQVASV